MYHKLPFYKCAADLLKRAKETNVSVKQVLFSDRKYKFMNVKSLYALVSEALKHWEILEILINDSKILVEESWLNIWHVRILMTELLFGKKEVDGENKLGQAILHYKEKFKELLLTKRIKKLLATVSKGNVEIKVRYVKVNTIKNDVDSVINYFIKEGWKRLETADSYEGYLDQLRNLEQGSKLFLQDFHIPEVLTFPPGTELYALDLYKNGSLYFMDKSSCLAPHLLRPHPHSSVLDMCAAPGLKTILLAGLLNQSGKIYAVERNAERFISLKEMVGRSGAENVETLNLDATKLELDQFKDVEYILLDPTCSGSGMRDRQPLAFEEDQDYNQRIHRLAGFQLTLLRFALTRFPAAKRVVYSTCSLKIEENEVVVQAALNSKYHDFEIASVGKKLPEWVSWGSEDFEFGTKCIYSRPEKDLTNGFFVAVFERKKHYVRDQYLKKANDSVEVNSRMVEKDKKDDSTALPKKKSPVSYKMSFGHNNDEFLGKTEKVHGNFSRRGVKKDTFENKVSKKRTHTESNYCRTEEFQSHKRFKGGSNVAQFYTNDPGKVCGKFSRRDVKKDTYGNEVSKKRTHTPCDKNVTNGNTHKMITQVKSKSLKKRERQRKVKVLQTRSDLKGKKVKDNTEKSDTNKCNDSAVSSKVSTKNAETYQKTSKSKLRKKRLQLIKIAKASRSDKTKHKKIKHSSSDKECVHDSHNKNNESENNAKYKHKKSKSDSSKLTASHSLEDNLVNNGSHVKSKKCKPLLTSHESSEDFQSKEISNTDCSSLVSSGEHIHDKNKGTNMKKKRSVLEEFTPSEKTEITDVR